MLQDRMIHSLGTGPFFGEKGKRRGQAEVKEKGLVTDQKRWKGG